MRGEGRKKGREGKEHSWGGLKKMGEEKGEWEVEGRRGGGVVNGYSCIPGIGSVSGTNEVTSDGSVRTRVPVTHFTCFVVPSR